MIIPPAIKGKVKDAISLVLALNSAKLMPNLCFLLSDNMKRIIKVIISLTVIPKSRITAY